MDRRTKIIFGEMRAVGVRGILVLCDYRYSYSIALMADKWPDQLRLSDIELRFACSTCGKRGDDVATEFRLERPLGRSAAWASDDIPGRFLGFSDEATRADDSPACALAVRLELLFP